MRSFEDILNEETIQSHVPSFYSIHCIDSVDSTNTWLSKHCDNPEGYCLIADHQRAGKGRNQRTFHSPQSSGIYLSLLLKPNENNECTLRYTALCAVAMCEAIEELYGIEASIKWLNDIYFQNRKLGGILCEGKLQGKHFESLIIGIGINVHAFIHPQDIAPIAASIEDFSPIKKSRNELIARFLSIFYDYYKGQHNFYDAYTKRLAYIGQTINVLSSNKSYQATLEGVDTLFRLIIRKQDQTIDHLASAEISIRPDIQS